MHEVGVTVGAPLGDGTLHLLHVTEPTTLTTVVHREALTRRMDAETPGGKTTLSLLAEESDTCHLILDNEHDR